MPRRPTARAAVLELLASTPDAERWPDAQIAEAAGVSVRTVGRARAAWRASQRTMPNADTAPERVRERLVRRGLSPAARRLADAFRSRPWALEGVTDAEIGRRYGVHRGTVARVRRHVASGAPDARIVLLRQSAPVDEVEPEDALRAALDVAHARIRHLERALDTYRHRGDVKRARNLERLAAWGLAQCTEGEIAALPAPFDTLAEELRLEEIEGAGGAYWEREAAARFGAVVGPVGTEEELERDAERAIWIEEQTEADPYPLAVLARRHGGA